jgi:hypothetical protein
MTLPRPCPPRLCALRPYLPQARRPLRLALLGCALTALLAGCSDAAAQVRLPPKPAKSPVTAVARAAALTPAQQATSALTGYVSALGQAGRARSAAVARQLLRPYLAGDRINGVVAALSGIWARGDTFYGQDVLHVLTVRVQGHRAFVHDCDNTSGMGLDDPAGQPVPGSAGVPADNIVTRLDLTGGHWLVEFQLIEDVPCAP